MNLQSVQANKNNQPVVKAKVQLGAVAAPMSAEKIREARQEFERSNQQLASNLGSKSHQYLLKTMYEGTEHMVNKNLSEFDLKTYLETLKLAANELHQQGLAPADFSAEIMRKSEDSVANLLRNI